MPHLTIQLKSWKQILAAAILLVGALVGYSVLVQSGLDAKLPRLVESRLRIDLENEITRQTLLPTGAPYRAPTRAQAEKYVEEHKKLGQLKIVSVEKRGWRSSAIVRVKFTLGDSDGEQVRYYRLKHNWFSGWYVWSPVSERSWHIGWL